MSDEDDDAPCTHCPCWHWTGDDPTRRPGRYCCDCGAPNPRRADDVPEAMIRSAEQSMRVEGYTLDRDAFVAAVREAKQRWGVR